MIEVTLDRLLPGLFRIRQMISRRPISSSLLNGVLNVHFHEEQVSEIKHRKDQK